MDRFDTLGDQVAATLDVDNAILDGEVITADETGRPQFYDLLRRTGAPAYVAFDLLWIDCADPRALPLNERRKRLRTILPRGSPVVTEALSVTGRGRELFELMRAHDLEASSPSARRIRMTRASGGSKSKTRITCRTKVGANCSTDQRGDRRVRQAGAALLTSSRMPWWRHSTSGVGEL